jgi:hypothetical protein
MQRYIRQMVSVVEEQTFSGLTKARVATQQAVSQSFIGIDNVLPSEVGQVDKALKFFTHFQVIFSLSAT